MSIRSILVALTGVAIAGGSAFAMREYLVPAPATAATDAQAPLVNVVVAGTDIPFGQAILPQSLQMIQWPRTALPPGSYTDMALLVPESGQPPRRATRAMAQGELILASKVSNFGEKVTIVQSLGPNARAMAIKVDAETAVGGFVTPGDSVDVLLTQGRDRDLRAVTILQNVRVLGVDQDADEKSDKPEIARTVTVEVTPEQGQILALAQKAGTLSLSLRTLDAAVDAPLESIRLSDVLRDVSPVEPEEVARQTIRIRRAGSEVEMVQVK